MDHLQAVWFIVTKMHKNVTIPEACRGKTTLLGNIPIIALEQLLFEQKMNKICNLLPANRLLHIAVRPSIAPGLSSCRSLAAGQ